METKEVKQHVKLGAFVLGGLVLFIAAVFLIGSENNIFSRTFTIAAMFKNVEGLKEGDNVWLSGVKIGTVKEVSVAAEGKVLVTLLLKDSQSEFVRKDATAMIGSDGLVGNKIVVIRPGVASEPIAEHDTIATNSPTDTQQILNIAKEVGDNTKMLTADLSAIADKIAKGQGIVGELLNDGAIAQELRHAVANLSQTGSNTASASAELHKLLYEMRNGDGLMPMLVRDTAYANNFKNALASIEQVSSNAQRATENLQEMTTRFNDDDNAIGVLLNDKATADRIKNAIENAEMATKHLDENMEALQHNFLFRGYFRKQAKREREEEAASSHTGNQ